MKRDENLNRDVPLVSSLETAIDHWLVARLEYKKQASDENQHAYNATYFVLGEAWAERYPEAAAEMPGAFDWFRRGLIALETDE